jgi:hypothetical protein
MWILVFSRELQTSRKIEIRMEDKNCEYQVAYIQALLVVFDFCPLSNGILPWLPPSGIIMFSQHRNPNQKINHYFNQTVVYSSTYPIYPIWPM